MTERDADGDGWIEGATHYLPLRVQYEDTDLSGAVYHANYLKFMERGRSDYVRLIAIDQTALAAGPEGVFFVVRHCAIAFLKPARLDDRLQVRTRFTGDSGARLNCTQSVWRGTENLARADITLACVGKDGRPKRLPAILRQAVADLLTDAE
ncbi:MAG TPA: acyl-CoA thioesterase [Alphaproteobacteria bacterium]|jgi:acyl-CoA thioester hydrolase|nr:acyl-CoA thioesterase [Alphaproteobacteria bacterium]HBA42039.1 acyl-CoA thioesterase [Alphaproteobacteria bacterium]HBC53339.1 acyl-CoA thioesterase [Alphaproteobacteria bacterium]HBF99692.1 acyl-CoA thioesterase [Alphaproteobacteria bacterium]HCO92078.1 acyl-CoA thioesterase [Alphaproteobacteria bacterium]